MTPIEKNIRVVDEQGNEYEATYPKRAKGLVKHGRARFTDENTICLARPPEITEDKMKKDNVTTVNEAEIEKIEVKDEEEYAAATAEAGDAETTAKAGEDATDALNGETVSAAKATEADVEITEAKLLALIERLTDMAASTVELAARLIPLTPEIMEVDEYSDRAETYNMSISSMIKDRRQMIESLNATANRMLDYLEKKQQAERQRQDIDDLIRLFKDESLPKYVRDGYKQMIDHYFHRICFPIEKSN